MSEETLKSAGKKIGFIGAGNMGGAMIYGLVKSNSVEPADILASYPSAPSVKRFAALNLSYESNDNNYVAKNSDVIVLCVKPQQLQSVCLALRDSIEPERHLIVSIAAGVTLKKLASYLNKSDSDVLKIARCSLNTAAAVGASCSVFSQNGNLSEEEKKIVRSLLNSVGPCIDEVKDVDMDAAMSVGACSIAYLIMMVDAMSDAGVKMGLNRNLALRMSVQAMRGAGELMAKNLKNVHIMQLKDEVCSPGGTTIQGLHELERHGFRNSIISAIEAATNRAKQF